MHTVSGSVKYWLHFLKCSVPLFIISKCFSPGWLDSCSLACRCLHFSSERLLHYCLFWIDAFNVKIIWTWGVKIRNYNQSNLTEVCCIRFFCQDSCVCLHFQLSLFLWFFRELHRIGLSMSAWKFSNSLDFGFFLFPGVTAAGWSLFHHPKSKTPHCPWPSRLQMQMLSKCCSYSVLAAVSNNKQIMWRACEGTYCCFNTHKMARFC